MRANLAPSHPRWVCTVAARQCVCCCCILTLQVPLRLGKACCKLLNTPWRHAIYVAIRPWRLLLDAVTEAGIICEGDSVGSNVVV